MSTDVDIRFRNVFHETRHPYLYSSVIRIYQSFIFPKQPSPPLIQPFSFQVHYDTPNYDPCQM